jgi:hypothetical protein
VTKFYSRQTTNSKVNRSKSSMASLDLILDFVATITLAQEVPRKECRSAGSRLPLLPIQSW